MTETRYAAAHVAAPLIHNHFARHLAASGAAEPPAAPEIGAIEALIDAAYADMKRRLASLQ